MKWAGRPATFAPVDDDWYYEMAAVRALKKHGVGLTVEQLGQQWAENRAAPRTPANKPGSISPKGSRAPTSATHATTNSGSPSGRSSAAISTVPSPPACPTSPAAWARTFGHINGYAEGTDGAVFTAVAISLGFTTQDLQTVIRKAVKILHPSSPYRQSIEQIIALADSGKSFDEIVTAVEDRWHAQNPATNNAVPNRTAGNALWRNLTLK